jgi:hypothetical protein
MLLLMMIVVQKNLNEFDNNWKEQLALLFLPSTRIECSVHLFVVTPPLEVAKITCAVKDSTFSIFIVMV